MKLYQVAWSVYTRRIGIYLAEKHIDGIERIEVGAPKEPSARILQGITLGGTVPALDTGDGMVIGSSIAILEYLEERFPSPSRLGETPNARARTRELVSVSDESTMHLGIWVRNASRLFPGPLNSGAAEVGREAFFGRLRLLDQMGSQSRGEFLAGNNVTIADYMTFATLQTAKEFWGVPVPRDCAYLGTWYARFASRPSAAVPQYPPPLLDTAKDFREQLPK
jgi:glutathione S-transferase